MSGRVDTNCPTLMKVGPSIWSWSRVHIASLRLSSFKRDLSWYVARNDMVVAIFVGFGAVGMTQDFRTDIAICFMHRQIAFIRRMELWGCR
jgi:hypothetical protein